MKTLNNGASLAVAVALAMLTGCTRLSPADKLANAHIDAIGGIEVIHGVKSIQRKGTLDVDFLSNKMSGSIEVTTIPSRKAYQVIDLGLFNQETGWNGETGWEVSSQQDLRELEGEQLRLIKTQSAIDLLAGYRSQIGSAQSLELLEDATIDGVAYFRLQLNSEDTTPVQIFIDKKTYLAPRMELDYSHPDFGLVHIIILGEDYKSYNGLKLPTKVTLLINDGSLKLVANYTETLLDVQLDKSIFEKP